MTETFATPRLVLSGVAAGVGKSLLGIGLTQEFRRRGLGVACCVIGPQLTQAVAYKRLSGRFARCLDHHLLTPGQLLTTALQGSSGADILLIEGRAGLFDGDTPRSSQGSDAEIATLTRSPVALVVNGQGFGASICALIKGFEGYNPECQIKGTLINRVSDPVHAKPFFETAFQGRNLPAPISVFPEHASFAGMNFGVLAQARNVTSLPRSFFVELSELVQKHVDIDACLRMASSRITLKLSDSENKPHTRRVRIAVSEDVCFHLCFQDNLDLLKYFGAEIVPFSPLADSGLPEKIGALYMTGAFLAEYGEELSQNSSLHQEIKNFVAEGGVLYAEGASTALLCRQFRPTRDGAHLPGIGLIRAVAEYEKPEITYGEATTIEESILGRTGLGIKGINTGEWELNEEGRGLKVFSITSQGRAPVHEGFSPGAQAVCTFSFLHFGSNPEVAKALVDAAEVVQRIE